MQAKQQDEQLTLPIRTTTPRRFSTASYEDSFYPEVLVLRRLGFSVTRISKHQHRIASNWGERIVNRVELRKFASVLHRANFSA